MSTVSSIAPASAAPPAAVPKPAIQGTIQAANQNHIAKKTAEAVSTGVALLGSNHPASLPSLSSFEQKVDGNPPFGMNSEANSDYQALTQALQAGDLSAAQQALANLQDDLKTPATTTKKTHSGHHHATSATANSAPSATVSSATSVTSGIPSSSAAPAIPALPLPTRATGNPPGYLTDLIGENVGSDTERGVLNVTA